MRLGDFLKFLRQRGDGGGADELESMAIRHFYMMPRGEVMGMTVKEAMMASEIVFLMEEQFGSAPPRSSVESRMAQLEGVGFNMVRGAKNAK